MLNPLFIIFITTLCYQYASCRHLSQPNYHHSNQPYYQPYPDYGYSYGGYPNHYQQYQQNYSPFFPPPGTYLDQRRGIFRPFPGGGVAVYQDYHKLCSNQFIGVKAHPDDNQYYCVCKPDCVIIGKCQNLQIFNSTCGQCVQHPKPEYIPTCTEIGRFPIFSDCHLYYKCEKDMKPKIYACPAYTIFSAVSKKCIRGNKCTPPTQISTKGSNVPEYCNDKYPVCYEDGVFRTPTDCSLYYECKLHKNKYFLQTRSRCPNGEFYDIQKKKCLPSEQVPCDCIQVADLVYPKPDTRLPYQPPIYPAPYDFDSLEENHYPIEQSEEGQNKDCNPDVSESESKSNSDSDGESNSVSEHESESENNSGNEEGTQDTTLIPKDEQTSSEEDGDGTEILGDYIDINGLGPNKTPQSGELDPSTTPISSEEDTTTEGSGSESDEEQETVTNDVESLTDTAVKVPRATTSFDVDVEDKSATTEGSGTESDEVQETTLRTATATNNDESMTDETGTTIQDVDDISLEPDEEEQSTEDAVNSTENEIATSKAKEEEEKTETPTNVFETTKIPASTTIGPCIHTEENIKNEDKPLGTDTHSNDNSQTLTKPCLPQIKTTGLDIPHTDPEPTKTTLISKITRDSRSTIHAQNPTTSHTTVIPDITHLPTTGISESFENLESNLLSSETSLETADSTQTTKKPTTSNSENQEADNVRDAMEDKLLGNELPTSSEETEEPSIESTTEPLTVRTSITTEAKIESTVSDLEVTTAKNKPETTTEPSAAGTETPDSHNDFTVSNTANTIDDSTFWLNKENPKAKHDKTVTMGRDDLSDEEFLPVRGRSTILDELPDHTTDFNYVTDETTDATDETTDFAYVTDETTDFYDYDMDTTVPTRATEDTTDSSTITKEDKGKSTRSLHTFHPKTTKSSTETPATTLTTTEDPDDEDELGVLDSEIVLQDLNAEVSKTEFIPSEITPTTEQSIPPQTPFSTSTPTTQMPPTTPITTDNPITPNPVSEPCEKLSKNCILKVREEKLKEELTSQEISSPSKNKSLYYILKTQPVINCNNTNTNASNETVPAQQPCTEANKEDVPRLEIIAQRPIDVHFSICPKTCNKDHKHNYPPTNDQAVFLRWFANKSKKTIGFETVNEIKTDDHTNC